MEQLDLAVAITFPTRTFYRVSWATFNWDDAAIRIAVKGSDGVVVNASYDGATATALMLLLDTSNNSTTSLHKRILQKLQTDGFLPAGNVSGTPS